MNGIDSTLRSPTDGVLVPSPLDSSSAKRVREELERLCENPLFVRSPVAARLLRYLVEEELAGRSTDLKESTIGNGLYGRMPTYDTKEDAVVRVNANRLRLRLDDYYSARPNADVRIVLTKGSYIPTYRFGISKSSEMDEHVLSNASSETFNSGLAGTLPQTGLPAAHSRKWHFVALVAVACAGALMAWQWSRWIKRGEDPRTTLSWSVRPFTRLAGSQNFASFAPNGSTVAFAWIQAGAGSGGIYTQNIPPGTPKPLLSGSDDYSRPAWSPDGRTLAYVQTRPGGWVDIWLLYLQSGARDKVISIREPQTWLCLRPRLTWTQDGRSIVTSSAYPGSQACGVVSIDLATRAVHPVTRPTTGMLGDVEAAVSPAGDSIAFIRTFSFMRSDLFLVPVAGGTPHRVTFDERDLLGFAWAPSGRFFYTASKRVDGILRLWETQLNGTTRQLTDGSAAAAFPSVSKDGRQIVFTDYHNVIDFSLLRDGHSKTIIADNSENSDAEISPDGKRLLYGSDRSGAVELWISDIDGTNQRRIADASVVSGRYASWSPDGRQVAFECRNPAGIGICVMQQDGSHIVHLSSCPSSCLLPAWTRDGRGIYYTSKISGAYQIYRLMLDGSQPVQITHHGGMRAIEALDGKSVFVHRGPAAAGISRLPVAGTDAAREYAETHPLLDLPESNWSDWAVSRGAIYYIARGQTDRLYRYDLQTQRRTPVLTLSSLPTQSGRDLSVSPDGHGLLLEEGRYSAQLDLMEQH